MKLKFLIILLPLCVTAQEISLEKIMSDPIWIGATPNRLTIAEETNMIYFQVPRAIPLSNEWKKMDPADGTVSPISDDDRPYFMSRGSEQHGSVRIHSIDGDLWISRANQPRTPLISRGGRLTFVRFLDEQRFVFAEDKNLHLFDLKSGTSIQLTDLRLKKEPEKDKKLDYLAREERTLLSQVDQLYVRKENRETDREDRRRLGPLTKPTPTWLGKGMGYRDTASISEDLRYVALSVGPKQDEKGSVYAQFINKEARVKELKSRPKVGEETETSKLTILDRENNQLIWFDPAGLPEIKTDRLASIKAALSEDDKKHLPKLKEDTPRQVNTFQYGFGADGKNLLVSVGTIDYKDQWLLLVSSETGEWKLIEHHYDEAWAPTYFPSVETSNENGRIWWSKDRSSVYFMSDKSGYQHLYRYDVAKEETTAVTAGKFEIYSPFEGPKGRYLYFHANRVHPGEYHFYRMPLEGGQWTQLTKVEGRHRVSLSEDGSLMVDFFSTATMPPVIRIKEMGKKKWKRVYDGRSEAFKAIKWATPEYVTYANREGKDVHARLYKPEKPNGAGVVFVHGAGYLQNAHKGWSGYYHEYMFHNLLLREGYTVLDPDYQASAGYGRDWRTAIYRHMGGKDLEDVVDGAHLLMEEHGVDRKRVGVYGGSYGGFITFMAMFTTPDVFVAGAALRPVSDWAHYNHWYTARILNTPKVDPVAYRRSSPIYFADGLKGDLLICHGVVDPNVQYQDVVRLSQKFIELGKKGWELASYPVEGHGFRTPSSWFDEYRRIHELFTETLQ